MDTRIIKGIIVAAILAWSIYSFTQGNIDS